MNFRSYSIEQQVVTIHMGSSHAEADMFPLWHVQSVRYESSEWGDECEISLTYGRTVLLSVDNDRQDRCVQLHQLFVDIGNYWRDPTPQPKEKNHE